jgi:hypothetical protein
MPILIKIIIHHLMGHLKNRDSPMHPLLGGFLRDMENSADP